MFYVFKSVNVRKKDKKAVQGKLFIEFKPEEQKIYDLLKENKELSIDQISLKSNLPMSKV